MPAERRLTTAKIEDYFDTRDTSEGLEALAEHCIEAKKLADRVGTPSMRRLADLMLFEIGIVLAAEGGGKKPSDERA